MVLSSSPALVSSPALGAGCVIVPKLVQTHNNSCVLTHDVVFASCEWNKQSEHAGNDKHKTVNQDAQKKTIPQSTQLNKQPTRLDSLER
jgi:hypothetical protein